MKKIYIIKHQLPGIPFIKLMCQNKGRMEPLVLFFFLIPWSKHVGLVLVYLFFTVTFNDISVIHVTTLKACRRKARKTAYCNILQQ